MKCNHINYRQGYIEITPNIHKGCISIESWDINAEYDISKIDLKDAEFQESQILANTEMELTIAQAEALIKDLQWAIDKSAI